MTALPDTAASARGRRNRRAGADAENALAGYLRDAGYPECRRQLERRQDRGDLLGVGDVGLEVKNCRKHDLAAWTAQARQGCEAAGLLYPVTVVKPPRITDPGRWYAVLTVDTLVALLREATK